MKLEEKQLPEFIQEIRNILGNIKGVNGRISENFSLSFVCVVDTEEEKENVEKIANVLTEQATQYAIDLEVVPALESEMKDAREALLQMQMKEQGSFEV